MEANNMTSSSSSKTLPSLILTLVIACFFVAYAPGCTGSGAPPENYEQLRFEFCASIKSDNYHMKQCNWARQIYADHLIMYQSKEAVLASGKKPCKICLPAGIE